MGIEPTSDALEAHAVVEAFQDKARGGEGAYSRRPPTGDALGRPNRESERQSRRCYDRRPSSSSLIRRRNGAELSLAGSLTFPLICRGEIGISRWPDPNFDWVTRGTNIAQGSLTK